MNRMRGKFYAGFVLMSLIFLGWGEAVHSQEKYPTRAIEIIVPFGPGGNTDLVTRVLANYVKDIWKVPVNVVNKSGGNTVPASLEVLNSKPDGYTLLADCSPSTSMLPYAIRNVPFNITDRTFVLSASIYHLIYLVQTNSPIKSLKDLEVEVKRDPQNFTWASLGGAAQQDYGTRQFLRAIGVDVMQTKAVMAQSGSQAMTLTAGGHVKMGPAATGSAAPGIRGGLVRGLAITYKSRWPDLPDIPTTAEAGYPSLNSSQWNGISGPANLPSEVVAAWNQVVQQAAKDPNYANQLRNVGALPFYLNESDVREYVKKETITAGETYGKR